MVVGIGNENNDGLLGCEYNHCAALIARAINGLVRARAERLPDLTRNSIKSPITSCDINLFISQLQKVKSNKNDNDINNQRKEINGLSSQLIS